MPRQENIVLDVASLFPEGKIIVWQLEYPSWIAKVYGAEEIPSLLYDGRGVPATFNWQQYIEENCHPDDAERVKNEITDAVGNSKSYTSEFRTWDKERKIWRYWFVFGKIKSNESEGGYTIFGGLQDIGERRRYQRALVEKHLTDEQMQVMLDAMPMPCCRWDEKYRLIDCNGAALGFFGFEGKKEFIRHFDDLSPEYQPNGKLSSELLREKVKLAYIMGLQSFAWLHNKQDGEPLPVEITLVRVKHDKSYVVVAYISDMRGASPTRTETRAADDLARVMLDAAPLCCNFWDANYNNIGCNREAANLFGLSGKQEYLDRFSELSPEYQPDGRLSSESAREKIKLAFETGYQRFEWTHRKLSGEPVPAEITLVRVKYGDGCVVAGYTRDLRELKAALSEIRKAEEELRAARNAAEDSARAKSDFLADMSREIRAPMNAILDMTRPVRQDEITAKRQPLEPLNTLLVGDNDSALASIQTYFNLLHCSVVSTIYGMETFDFLSENLLNHQNKKIELVVMDLKNIETDGVLAFQKLESLFGDDMPYVLFAVSDYDDDKLRSVLGGGRWGVFRRPVTLSSLYGGIANVIHPEEEN